MFYHYTSCDMTIVQDVFKILARIQHTIKVQSKEQKIISIHRFKKASDIDLMFHMSHTFFLGFSSCTGEHGGTFNG